MVEPGGTFCTCGDRGCLETLIGGDALLEQAKTVVGQRRMPSPDGLDALIQMAVAGNVACQRVLEEAGRTLGLAVGNLCNVLNPNVIVLGGALGQEHAAEFTLGPCQAALRQTAIRAAAGNTLVVQSRVPHAAALGALIIGLEGTEY